MIKSIMNKLVDVNKNNIDNLIEYYKGFIQPHKDVVDGLIKIKNENNWGK